MVSDSQCRRCGAVFHPARDHKCPRYYTLDGDHNLVGTDDVMVWAAWYENFEGRVLARDELGAGLKVITVCTGIDHSFGESEKPLLFATAILKDGVVDEMETSTYDEAMLAHAVMVDQAGKT